MSRPTLPEIVSCLSDYDPDALPVLQAQQIIREIISPLTDVESIGIMHALGRVLAEDIVSPIDVPGHDNSAMDGYALCSDDINDKGPTVLKIIGTALAGKAHDGAIGPRQCVQIMTGAVMPEGCDTVVPQEFTSVDDEGHLVIPEGVLAPGDNRRLRGEDLKKGGVALSKGMFLRPASIGLLASLGIGTIPVYRRLRVAFFSTGDELRSVGEALDPGCVYDSNRYTIHGMLTRLGCEVIDMGVVRDDPVLLETALRQACEQADAIVTSGGVSVGAADYTKQVMGMLGDMAFWKIGMRPGRPMAFGNIHSNGKSALLFGLPGNPVAVMVTFYFFVRDALQHMMGATPAPLPRIHVKSQTPIRKKAGRTEYQRGILSRNEHGDLQVSVTGSQGSGILRSMVEANCMILLEHDRQTVHAGDMVEVVVFDGLV